jgi:putative membrane protein
MTLKQRLILALKGVCMGIADIIPGVSGGTLALILGIYQEFIDSLRSLNLKFVKPLLDALRTGFAPAQKEALKEAMGTMRLGWLLTLGAGIAVAMGIGSKVIPALMERYPEVMNALFFGLILASIAFPLRMMKRKGGREVVYGVVGAVAAFVVVGASFTPPLSWHTVEAQAVEAGGQTLKDIAEAGPSALKPVDIYRHPNNAALRVATGQPLAVEIDPVKVDEKAYGELTVPAGTPVEVPRPAAWFILIAGFIAISAMLLPGISGSFMLLAMGSYYFMLNALKGFLRAVAHLHFPGSQLVYVGLFIVGMVTGLVLFSRLLSWLFHKHPDATLATLTGVMLGCLRTIWPFKISLGASVTEKVNMFPTHISAEGFCAASDTNRYCWSQGTMVAAGVALIGGILLVTALDVIGRRLEVQKQRDAHS